MRTDNKMSSFALYVCILCALGLQTTVCMAADPNGQQLQGKSEGLFPAGWDKYISGTEKKDDAPKKDPDPMKGLMTSISIVIVLGVCAYWFTRKFAPKLTRIQGKNVSVIETIPLGSNRNLYLLKIGGQKLLIGSTNENINLLADVTESLSSQGPTAAAKG